MCEPPIQSRSAPCKRITYSPALTNQRVSSAFNPSSHRALAHCPEHNTTSASPQGLSSVSGSDQLPPTDRCAQKGRVWPALALAFAFRPLLGISLLVSLKRKTQ